MNYSILILTRNEAENLAVLLPQVIEVMNSLRTSFEIVVMDGNSTDDTAAVAAKYGARVFQQVGRGYGAAFKEGIQKCVGDRIIGVDADCSHPPAFLRAMTYNAEGADLVIASRYVTNGAAYTEWSRKTLSKILSLVFRRTLSLPALDVSSGFRLYRRDAIQSIQLEGENFDVLIEVLVKMVASGYRVREIPFIYEPRIFGKSKARLAAFAVSYLKTLHRLWNLKNNPSAADYDERGYDSAIPIQRFWHRARVRNILALSNREKFTLHIGSASSRVTRLIPKLVAVDHQLAPLRFISSHGVETCSASLLSLPFATGTVSQIILNHILELYPANTLSFDEIRRVLAPGGSLIIATPNYGSSIWRFIEKCSETILPHSRSSTRVAQLTKDKLMDLLSQGGFVVRETKDILGAEIAIRAERQ